MEKNRNVSLQVDGKGKKKKDKAAKTEGGESSGGREKCLMMWNIIAHERDGWILWDRNIFSYTQRIFTC